MRNFVVIENKPQVAIESIYNTVANAIEENKEINLAFKQLDRGFEAYEVISKIRVVVGKQKTLTPALESSLNQSVQFYKDILGDYSPNVSLESFTDPKRKRSIALEGIGNWLNRIWEAIKNFFKRIWNWITGKKESTSNSKNAEQTHKEVEQNKKILEETKKEIQEFKKRNERELEDLKHARNLAEAEEKYKQILKEKEAAEKDAEKAAKKLAFVIEQKRIKKVADEKAETALLQVLSEHLEKENKVAFEEKIEERNKKINKLTNEFYDKYKKNIDKTFKRTEQYPDFQTFFYAMQNVLTYLGDEVNNGVRNMDSLIKNLDAVVADHLIKSSIFSENSTTNIGFSIPSSRISEAVITKQNRTVENDFFKEVSREIVSLYDNKALSVTTLRKLDINKFAKIDRIKTSAPIVIETIKVTPKNTTSQNKRALGINPDFFYSIVKIEERNKKYLALWADKAKAITDLTDKIQTSLNKTYEDEDNKIQNEDVEKYVDDFKKANPIEHDKEYLEEKRLIAFTAMKMIIENAKNITSAFPITETILLNTIEIYKTLNENDSYKELVTAYLS